MGLRGKEGHRLSRYVQRCLYASSLWRASCDRSVTMVDVYLRGRCNWLGIPDS